MTQQDLVNVLANTYHKADETAKMLLQINTMACLMHNAFCGIVDKKDISITSDEYANGIIALRDSLYKKMEISKLLTVFPKNKNGDVVIRTKKTFWQKLFNKNFSNRFFSNFTAKGVNLPVAKGRKTPTRPTKRQDFDCTTC